MPDITKIKIGNERERSYKDFPANREFKKRAEDDNPGGGGWPSDLPKPSVGGYGYTEQGEPVLLFDGELLIDQSMPTGAVFGIIDIDSLEVGEAYKIVWNGVDYTCECMTFNIGGNELVYLGNLSIAGPYNPTDYPFIFVYGAEAGYMVATLTAGTYSIKLSKSGETIHKIDNKYLPDGGFGYTEQGNQTVITWDGDTEGRVVIPAGGNSYIVKVSDKVPSYDELIDSEIIKNTGGTAIVSADNVTHTDEYLSFAVDSYFMCFVALNDNITVSGVQLPERGVYFSFFSGRYISSLTYGTPDTVHKIDEKYLPVAQEKTEVIVTNIGDAWEFDAETIPQNLDDYSNINFIVYYLAPTAVGHDYIYAVIPCATCTYQFNRISSISGLPFVNGSTMIVPRIVYSENTNRYYGRVSEYGLQDHIK